MSTLALADAGKPSERYTRVPAGADGIGKRYIDRDIAGVMGWQGAAWLEREERGREERVAVFRFAGPALTIFCRCTPSSVGVWAPI